MQALVARQGGIGSETIHRLFEKRLAFCVIPRFEIPDALFIVSLGRHVHILCAAVFREATEDA